MSSPLTDEELQRYTHLIDAILATADLETVTRKKVRKGLERALGGKDLSDQKVAIKDLIEARFDAINQSSDDANGGEVNGFVKNEDDDGGGEIKVSLDRDYGGRREHARDDDDDDDLDDGFGTPAKKKHKRSSSSVEDADARLAAELQAQENRLARARTTRGGGTAAKPTKRGGGAGSGGRAAAKKKSAPKTKVKVDDGSDSEGSPDVAGLDKDGKAPEKEKRKASGGFQKPFNLSYQLSELLGLPQLPRPQVVKKLWEYIKANELQDPMDKRQILCDEKMQAVFKQQKIDMFQMNKQLSNHLYPLDEE